MVYPPLDSTVAVAAAGAGELPDGYAAAEDEEWVSQTTRGIRLALPIAGLLAVVLVAAGFWGGAELEKNRGSSNSPASLASRFRSAAGTGSTPGSGFPFGGGGLGGSSAAATGTLSVVAGNTLYVLTSTGSLVKVTLTKSTTITRNADTTAVDLRPGDTVTVQGATASNGDVAATSISATASGVSSSTGGFGGLGAPGGTGTTQTTTSPGG